MKIRDAGLADIDGILAIEEEAFRSDRLTRRKLRRLLGHGNAALLVADERRGVVGYALLLFRRGVAGARLYGIAVAASRRGRGLGRSLIRACERRARERRCAWLRLEVARRNKAAIDLYERQGYARIARLGPYYEDGSPADRYSKDLAKPRPRAGFARFLLVSRAARPVKSRRAARAGVASGAESSTVSGLERAATFDKGDNMPQKKKPAGGAKKSAPKAAKPAAKKPAPKKAAPSAKKSAPKKGPAKKAPPSPASSHPEEE